MKLRIDNGLLIFEDLPRLFDDLEQQYWIQDRDTYSQADENSDLKNCEIINCEGEVIFGDLQCWGHATLFVELLNAFEHYRRDIDTDQYLLVLKLPQSENRIDATE